LTPICKKFHQVPNRRPASQPVPPKKAVTHQEIKKALSEDSAKVLSVLTAASLTVFI